jgi:hypothetical protein
MEELKMDNSMESNVFQIKVNEMIGLFLPLYSNVGNEDPKKVPAQMIWGPPGIGKSQGIKAFAAALEETVSASRKTPVKVIVTDVRLLLFNPVDLRGIPVADDKRELAKWLKPQIFQMDPSPNIINILFLDEISAAPLSVQASAYQMTLDRVVGEHKLPDNCIVMAAGNRVTDKSVAYKMPKALSNRMTHFEIVPDIDDWKQWAIPHGVDSQIIGFLNFKNSALFKFDPNNDDVAFPSPRSWEFVDLYLKKFGSVEKAYPLIAGSIGKGEATVFKGYVTVFDKLPNIKNIYDGLEKEAPPKDPSTLYALSAAIASYAPKANVKQYENLLDYLLKMDSEYASLTIKDMCTLKVIKDNILKSPKWLDWCKKNRDFIL